MYQITAAFYAARVIKAGHRQQQMCHLRAGLIGDIQSPLCQKRGGVSDCGGVSRGVKCYTIQKKSPFHPRICLYLQCGA